MNCDCACQCWQINPVKQRITNTFIHADIFGQGSTLNVKCEPKPGEKHICKCENVFQKPVLKDTRHRPLDHPNQYFFGQDISGCECCTSQHSRRYQQNEPPVQPTDKTITFGKKAETKYYFQQQELPPAGKYDDANKSTKNHGLGRYSRGIHTGNADNYNGHESMRDKWFNDAKEKQIGKLNDHLGKGYSHNRKQLQMASNAFDFVQKCGCTQQNFVPTAKFQTTHFDNDCYNLCRWNYHPYRMKHQQDLQPRCCSALDTHTAKETPKNQPQRKETPAGKCLLSANVGKLTIE